MSFRTNDTADATLAAYKTEFDRRGFVVVPSVLASDLRQRLIDQVRQAMDPLVGPAEFEADVGYPGSPKDRSAPGDQPPDDYCTPTPGPTNLSR